MSKFFATVTISALLMLAAGCATKTAYIADGTRPEAVSAFSQDDLEDTVATATDKLLSLDRIHARDGAARAIVIVENVINDTSSRGRDADALAEGLGFALRERLTDSGSIIVYNREAAQNHATVKVDPQYLLQGRLTQRNLRQDNSDIQIEYSLNLQLIDLATGLEVWQKRTPLRKLAAAKNLQ